MAKEFTSSNFHAEVLASTKPSAVDFWATWCGPCKAMMPVLDELSKELEDTLTLGKLNVEQFPDIAGQFGVMTLPTILVFKNGTVVGQIVGALPKAELKNRILRALEN